MKSGKEASAKQPHPLQKQSAKGRPPKIVSALKGCAIPRKKEACQVKNEETNGRRIKSGEEASAKQPHPLQKQSAKGRPPKIVSALKGYATRECFRLSVEGIAV